MEVESKEELVVKLRIILKRVFIETFEFSCINQEEIEKLVEDRMFPT